MDITMDDSRITNVTQIREFLKGSIKFNLSLKESSIEEKYDFIDKTVDRLKYGKLLKRDKKAVLNSFKKLDIIAYQYSDNEFAEILREKERELFDEIAKIDKNGDLAGITGIGRLKQQLPQRLKI